MKNKYLKNLAGALALATLAACGGSGSCPPNGSSNTGELTLKLTAPDQYPAGMPTPTNAYLTMTNTSNVNATNLYYAIPDASNHTGVTITVANDSNPCKSIPAHQACSFPVVIAANANPGSFTVTATTEASSQNSVKKLWNTLKSEIGLQSNTLSLTANIGLTNVPANSASGANGITFLYAQTIAGNAQNTTQIEIVGVVNSATAGAFNTINLTDKDGNLLNFEVLSGNSGTGLTNLARGSIVTFMLTIPAGSSTYQFYAQTLENETPKSQGTVVNPIILTNSDSGVLVVQPGSFNLLAAESYTSQTITYTNIGNGDISGLSITQPDAPLLLSNNNCGSTLSAGKSCTVVLTSNATPGISGSGSLTAQYTNGSGNNTIISQYNYAGLNPQSGISLSAVNNFTFSADTVDSSQSTQVTIENTGNVNESNFVFSFSPNQYFTITTGTGATPCSVTSNTITSTLAAGNSCSITLTYNNPNIASSSSTMMINYNYNGQAATQVSKTMSYSTTQATASIGFNPASPYTFNSIIANGIESDTQIFTITNNGPDAVNGLFNTAITGDFNIMPSTGANDCQTKSNLASGQNCTLTLRFGPTATAANPAVGTFTLSGTSATGGTINSVMTLNGNARTPLSANVQIYSIGHSASVVYGDGESAGSAFQIELINAAGLAGFTLYYKNTGAFAATNFTVDTSSLPSGYTVDSDSTCGDGNTMTLESNGANYCYVILKPNTNSPGSLNITLTSMPATWTDERGPQTPQTISWDNGTNTQNTIYVNVFASPQVTAVMSSSSSGTPTITNPTENTDFYVVYTLTGGYSGQNFTYGVTLGGTSGSPAMSVYSPTTCTITSPATSCSIKIASGGAATNQSITYAPQGGAVTPTPASSGNFNVVVPPMFIFVTNGEYWGSFLGGAQSINAICGGDTNAPAGAASMNWNIATLLSNVIQPDTSYVYTDGTTTTSVIDASPSPVNFMSDSTDQTKLFTAQFGTGTQFRYVWGSNKSGTSNNCTSWTTDNPAPNYGGASLWNGSVVTLEAAVNGNGECSNVARLFCVQQPLALTISVANSSLKAGVDTANSCTTVTATLPAATTTPVNITFSIPAGVSSSNYYFAPAYGDAAMASATSCTITANGTTCDGAELLCAGSSTAGITETITAEDLPDHHYANATTDVTAVAPSCTDCNIFVTGQASMTQGNFGGLAQANTICQTAATNASYTGQYKAMMYGNNAIHAATYKRPDSTVVKIQTSSGDYLTPNLQNAIATSTFGNYTAWTGGSSGASTCSNWTLGSAYGQGSGIVGSPTSTTDFIGTGLNGSTIDCNEYRLLYCVQQ